MPDAPITRRQTDALERLAEIPPVGSEERLCWLVLAQQHGVEPFTRSRRRSWLGSEDAILTLMSEARKQGQRDVLGASSETTGLSPIGHAPAGHEPTAVDPSRGARLKWLSDAATQGEWWEDTYPEYDEDGGPTIDRIEGAGAMERGEPESIVQCSERNARFIVALVNAYRAGELVSALTAAIPSEETETAEELITRLERELGVQGINSVFRKALAIAKEAVADAELSDNRKEVMPDDPEPSGATRGSGSHVTRPREEVRASGGASILAGLQDALAFAEGDKSRATLRTFTVKYGELVEIDEDDAEVAIKNCAEAIAFFDQVRRSSPAEQIAVGADHWNWLEKACRQAAALAQREATR